MKKTAGIVREMDILGRVVFPIEMRNMMNIKKGDPLEIFIDEEKIILKKYLPGCIFCGNVEGITKFKNKNICESCLEEVRKFDI